MEKMIEKYRKTGQNWLMTATKLIRTSPTQSYLVWLPVLQNWENRDWLQLWLSLFKVNNQTKPDFQTLAKSVPK